MDKKIEQLTKRRPNSRSARMLVFVCLLVAAMAVPLLINRFGGHIPSVKADEVQLPESQRHPVTVKKLELALSRQRLEVTGTVQPELETNIASQISGRIVKVLVHEGDRVQKGQPLVTLDTRDFDAAVNQAEAALRSSSVAYETAKTEESMEVSLSEARIAEARARAAQTEAALQAAVARLDLARAGLRKQEREQAVQAVTQANSAYQLAETSLKRMIGLHREGAVSAQQLDQAKSQFEITRAQRESAIQAKNLADEGSRSDEIRVSEQAVVQARATVQEAQAGLRTAMTAAQQIHVRHQQVAGARAQIAQSRAGVDIATTTRGHTLLTSPYDGIVSKRMADPGAIAIPGQTLLKIQGGSARLEAAVPESALPFVSMGAELPLTLNSAGTGSPRIVGRVSEIAAQGDPGSHTFLVKLTLPQAANSKSGSFGTVRLQGGKSTALFIPRSAVLEREGLHFVYTVDDSHTAKLRLVTLGEIQGNQILVLSGMSPGERFVVSGMADLRDGSPVSVSANEGRSK